MPSGCAKIQAAYETLSEDGRRAKYDTNAGFVPSKPSTRAWREPSYEPCYAYTQDPPFWSAELREMTVQKCARITRIHHLEREIRDLVVTLDKLVEAEDIAVSKEEKGRRRFSFIKSRPPKDKVQRRQDFLTKSTFLNTHIGSLKNELRTAHENNRIMLEEENKRKTWWAKERVARIEEENRRAATTAAAEAARRKAERARSYEKRDPEAARVAEEARRQAREETTRVARAAKAEEEKRKRADRVREDPEAARKAEKEAREWVARQREETLKRERKGREVR